MSRHKRITNIRNTVSGAWTQIYWKFISENLDKDFDWEWISLNSSITWEIIRDNLDNPWGLGMYFTKFEYYMGYYHK